MDSAPSIPDPRTSTEPHQTHSRAASKYSNPSGSGKESGGGAQSRSRITVVCQECKRLKLKCDRKAPCGSCVKRETVVRCLYSAAATEKVDIHSVNNRLMEVEIALNALRSGVPLEFMPFNSTYPPVVQGTLERVSAYQTAVADGSYIPSSTVTRPPGSLGQQEHHHELAVTENNDFFLAGLTDSSDAYLHVLAHSEGIHLEDELTWRTAQTIPGPSALKVKEEPGWEKDGEDGIMRSVNSSGMSEALTSTSGSSAWRSKSKSLAAIPLPAYSQPSHRGAHPLLPPLNIYYEQSPSLSFPTSPASSSGSRPSTSDFIHSPKGFSSSERAPLFYPGTPGPLHPHPRQVLTSYSLEVPLSVVDASPPSAMGPPSLGDLDTLAQFPSVTPAVIDLLPPTASCARNLNSAKDALIAWPVEMGFPAGTAAWPLELKQRMGELPTPTLGWDAFFKRSKRLYSRKEASSSTSPSVSSSHKSKPKVRSSGASDAPPSSSGSGRAKEKPSSSGKKRATPVNVDRLKAIYFGTGSRGGAVEQPHEMDVEVLGQHIPPRRVNHMKAMSRPPSPSSSAVGQDPAPHPTSRHGKSKGKDSGSAPPPENLPFFALLCALMAVGSSHESNTVLSPPDTLASPPFLFALSQQALHVWLDAGEPLPAGREASEEMVKEARADYLRACLVGLRYLMGDVGVAMPSLATKQNHENPNRQAILSLVGKMVNTLRGWGFEAGLSVYPDTSGDPEFDTKGAPESLLRIANLLNDHRVSDKGKAVGNSLGDDDVTQLVERIRKREGEEARKRVFWDVLYYDLFVADSFGEPPLVPASCYSSPLPLIADEFNIVPSLHGHDVVMMEETAHTSKKGSDGKQEAERLRLERLYLVSRAQLTQLAFTVKQRISGSEYRRSYTLDQATNLEGAIKKWSENVPVELLLAFKYGVIGSSSELISMGESVFFAFGGVNGLNSQRDRSPETARTSAYGQSQHKPREEDGNERFKSSKLGVEEDHDGETGGIAISQSVASSETSTRILGCELALMVQLLLFKIYSPFSFNTAVQGTPTLQSNPALASPQQVTAASQAMIRICKILHELLVLPSKSRPLSLIPFPSIKSPLLSMCSLEKFIFDSMLVCTRVCFGIPSNDPSARTSGMKRRDAGRNEIMQSIGIALDLLESLYAKRRGKTATSSTPRVSPETVSIQMKLVESLRSKWTAKMSSSSSLQGRLKRTRSIMEEKRVLGEEVPIEGISPTEDGYDVGFNDNDDMDFHEVANLDDPDIYPLPPPSRTPAPPSLPRKHPEPVQPKSTDESGDKKSRSGKKSNLASMLTEWNTSSDKKKKKKAHSIAPGALEDIPRPAFGVRARPKDDLKKKLDTKANSAQQPLLTSVPRTIKDGKLGYLKDSQAEHAVQAQSPQVAKPAAPKAYSTGSKPGHGASVDTLGPQLSQVTLSHPVYDAHSTATINDTCYTASYSNDAMIPIGSMHPLPPPHTFYPEDVGSYPSYTNAQTIDRAYTQGAAAPPPSPSAGAADYFVPSARQPTNVSSYGEQTAIYEAPIDDNLVEHRESMFTPLYDLQNLPHQGSYPAELTGDPIRHGPVANWVEESDSAQRLVQTFEQWQAQPSEQW